MIVLLIKFKQVKPQLRIELGGHNNTAPYNSLWVVTDKNGVKHMFNWNEIRWVREIVEGTRPT